jgi:hypothetical protein
VSKSLVDRSDKAVAKASELYREAGQQRRLLQRAWGAASDEWKTHFVQVNVVELGVLPGKHRRRAISAAADRAEEFVPNSLVGHDPNSQGRQEGPFNKPVQNE